MHISPEIIYLWGLLDTLKAAATVIALLATLAGSICLVGGLMDEEALLLKMAKRILPFAAMACIVAVFAPSSKTFAMMVVLPKLADSALIQKDAPELYSLAVEALKAKLKDATAEKP